MEVQKTCYAPAFQAKFVDNKAFREVVQYANEKGCMRTLDSALNTLKKTNNGDITIFHGTSPDGKLFSNFRYTYRGFISRSCVNPTLNCESAAEASMDGILELSMLSKKFYSLTGRNPECHITPEDIIKTYTV